MRKPQEPYPTMDECQPPLLASNTMHLHPYFILLLRQESELGIQCITLKASLVPRPSEEGLVHTVVRMRVNLTNFRLKPEILLFLCVTITFEFHKLQVTIDN